MALRSSEFSSTMRTNEFRYFLSSSFSAKSVMSLEYSFITFSGTVISWLMFLIKSDLKLFAFIAVSRACASSSRDCMSWARSSVSFLFASLSFSVRAFVLLFSLASMNTSISSIKSAVAETISMFRSAVASVFDFSIFRRSNSILMLLACESMAFSSSFSFFCSCSLSSSRAV